MHAHMVGALLRREGLYSSRLETWRLQRDLHGNAGLAPKKRGRKPLERNLLQSEVNRRHKKVKRRAVATALQTRGTV